MKTALYLNFLPSVHPVLVYWADADLVIPSADTAKYALHSFRHYASKLWNSLPDIIRVSTSLAAFKAALETLDLDKECCSFCDEF